MRIGSLDSKKSSDSILDSRASHPVLQCKETQNIIISDENWISGFKKDITFNSGFKSFSSSIAIVLYQTAGELWKR